MSSEKKDFKKTVIGHIPKEWEIQEFSKILDDASLRNGLTKPTNIRGKGVKMVNMGELFNHDKIENAEMSKVPLSQSERKNFLLQKGDLLFARQSLSLSGVGKCSIFLDDEEDVTFEGHIIRARIDQRKANPLFFYYFFQSRMGRKIMEGYAEQVAAAGIRGSDLKKIPVVLPPIPEQIAIATFLDNLDCKIKNNLQMNCTLETIGQALFKHWFVDFEFPNQEGKPYKSTGGKMIDSEIGSIPFDWEIIQFNEIAEISNKAINPQHFKKTCFNHYSIPAFDEKKSPVSNLGEEIKSIKYLIDNESVLLSKLNPETPRLWLPFVNSGGYESICSTEFIVFKPKKGIDRAFIYSLIITERFQDFFTSLVTGSTGSRQRVHPKDSLNYKIALPKEKHLIDRFCNIVNPFFKKSALNIIQQKKLKEIRDLLLPQLMSGRIRVPINREKLEAT